MKKYGFYVACIILLLMLFLTSCGDNGKQPDTDSFKELRLYDILEDVTDNALPPLEVLDEVTAPGDFTPIKYLYRAPQELVGQKISLSLELMKMHDSMLLFQYVAETGKLIVLGSNSHNTQPVLLELQTEYDSMEEFLAETDCWKGTVTRIMIVCGNVWMYTENSIRISDENARYANGDSQICYGVITADERLYFDEIQPKDSYAVGFHRVMKHLGIEE